MKAKFRVTFSAGAGRLSDRIYLQKDRRLLSNILHRSPGLIRKMGRFDKLRESPSAKCSREFKRNQWIIFKDTQPEQTFPLMLCP